MHAESIRYFDDVRWVGSKDTLETAHHANENENSYNFKRC